MNKTWKESVVYQIYPRSFMDTNGDGIGDILGIISKLDYIKDLGVDVIWLSPVYASPNHDNGYDISDYLDINPEFGTMDDMNLLIEEAKKRDLKIIMDLVINHTSNEHEWFKKSAAGDPKYRDYYIWQDKPNNWTSFFGGKAWTKLGDQYYLHLFAKEQTDLNWKNPKVLEEVEDIMKFWLDKGIYGFRCDVINIIFKTSLANGKKKLILTGREHYHQQEGMHKILQTLRQDVLNKYDTFTVGETVLVTPKQANDLIYPEGKELDMVFSFAHMETDQINNKWFRTKFRPKKFLKVIDTWQKEVHWNANYLENHDQQRAVSRFANEAYRLDSAKMFATFLMSLKGTPYIYQGQEIGMTNGDFKDMSEFQDVETHNIYQIAKKLRFPKNYRFKMMLRSSRDNNRTPMQWSSDGGFTTGKPWLKQNANTKDINVKVQETLPGSILNYYKEMIKIRKTYKSLSYGEYKLLSMKHDVYIFSRTYEQEEIIIICNFTDKKKIVNPSYLEGKPIISNNQFAFESPSEHIDAINDILKPYETRMYLKG